jgi:hypothetical protein
VERGLYAKKLLLRQNCFLEFELCDPAPWCMRDLIAFLEGCAAAEDALPYANADVLPTHAEVVASPSSGSSC